jgi:hypothetical protein
MLVCTATETAVTAAILKPVHIDDVHADFMTELDFEAFRLLADTFGRRAGVIISRPASREDTDRILRDLARSYLGCA